MTIAELIEELRQYPQDMEIRVRKAVYHSPYQYEADNEYEEIFLTEGDNEVLIDV